MLESRQSGSAGWLDFVNSFLEGKALHLALKESMRAWDKVMDKLFNLPVLLDVTWLVLLGLILRNFIKDIRVLRAAAAWPVAQGKVESMELIELRNNYWPKLGYRYQVNQKNYVGTAIFLDALLNSPHSGYSRQVAYEVAHAYKQGNSVKVYYDPDAPEFAVLNTKVPRKLYFVTWVLSLMVLFHIGLMTYKGGA